MQYYEKGAMGGCTSSRVNMGVYEHFAGREDRAIKHWLIAASFGHIGAVNAFRKLLIRGGATKDQYAQALRQYQEYLDEVKSDQRDQAAAYSDQFKYLIEDST
jgi:hypothetical protein